MDPDPPPPGGKNNIVIIGGGATGAVTAHELARAGHKVTIVEAGPVGNGSSSRSAACIRQQWTTPSTIRGMMYATRYYDRWAEITGGTEPVIHHHGYLFLYNWEVDIEGVARQVAMQQEAGLAEVEFLDVDGINRRFDYVQTVGLRGATWCPTDGFLTHDLVYQDSIEAARRLSVAVLQHTKVVGSINDNGRIVKIIAERDGQVVEITADVVINATNAWASTVSQTIHGQKLRIEPRKRYLYHFHGMDKELGIKMPMIIGPNGAYSRPTPDGGGLLIGWLHHTEPVENPAFDSQDTIEPGFGISDPSDYGYAMREEVSHHLPLISPSAIRPLRTIGPTCGYYADTPDHNPFIGYDGTVRNLIHACGCSGHFLMHAPFTARILVELVSSGEDLPTIELPDGLGRVDVSPYHVNREIHAVEGLVL